MEILQVCSTYLPSNDGIAEYVRNISERLAKYHDVTVFTADHSQELPSREEINGVLVRRFKSFRPNNAYHLSFDMIKALKECKVDVIHGHNYHAFPLHFCRFATIRKRFLVNAHYHGHGHSIIRDLIIRHSKCYGRRFLRNADHILAISNCERALLVRDFTLSEGKITVIPGATRLSDFDDLHHIHRDARSILYVGRLEKYKGVQHIIKVLPLLSDDYTLRIVGEGVYEPKLRQLVHQFGLDKRVFFYKNLPRIELLNMYASAGLLLLLSKYEAFSLVVAEALASRTPCIVANTSALTEWIDNRNCYGVDYPVDYQRLANLIGKASSVEVKNVKIRDWDDVVAELITMYG